MLIETASDVQDREVNLDSFLVPWRPRASSPNDVRMPGWFRVPYGATVLATSDMPTMAKVSTSCLISSIITFADRRVRSCT